MSGRPEHESADGVERETEVDTLLVAEAGDDDSNDGREDDVSAEVGDLEEGRLKLGDSEEGLEVLVEDIEKSVRESPTVKRVVQVSKLQGRLLGAKKVAKATWARAVARQGEEQKGKQTTHRKKSEVIRPKAKYSWPLLIAGPAALTPETAPPPAIVVLEAERVKGGGGEGEGKGEIERRKGRRGPRRRRERAAEGRRARGGEGGKESGCWRVLWDELGKMEKERKR